MRAAVAKGWRWIALALAATLPYLNTLDYGFVNYDDHASIVDLPLIRTLSWRSLPAFFAPDIYAGLYEFMPLKNLSYAIDYAWFGASASAFRPQQIFWYLVGVLAVYVWLRMLLARLAELGRLGLSREGAEWVAFGASLLFALHPAHVESVTWLSGRKDLLSGAFTAAALGCGLVYSVRLVRRDSGAETRPRAWPFGVATLACLALGLLSKPTAMTIAPLLLVQEFWVFASADDDRPRTRKLWAARAWLYVPACLMTVGFALAYSSIVGPYTQGPAGNAHVLTGHPALRVAEQLARYVQLVVDPSSLVPIVPERRFSADYGSAIACAGYLSVLLFLAVLRFGLPRRHPLAFALLVFLASLLPSLIRPVWGQYVVGRYLYFAILGPTFALAWVCVRTIEQYARLRALLIATNCAVALIWIGGTLSYSSAFRSSEALWDYAIGVDPQWPKFYDMAARAALLKSDPYRAIARLEKCLEWVPESIDCAAPLGGLLLPIDPARGEALLKQVLPYDDVGTAHIRLAQHWSEHGRTAEAVALFEGWLIGRGTEPRQLEVLVALAIADNQMNKARSYLRKQVAAASMLEPASPPPSAAIATAAERAGDEAFAAQARAAGARCNRADCFAAALGVRP